MVLELMYIPATCQREAIEEASHPQTDCDDMAHYYAECILSNLLALKQRENGIDWALIDRAITRNSRLKLAKVKRRAWQLLEARNENAL
jgi:hypothetical protein